MRPSKARGSHEAKNSFLRRLALAAARVGQISRRKVEGRAALGPGGRARWIMGSMKITAARRRGWMIERWRLMET